MRSGPTRTEFAVAAGVCLLTAGLLPRVQAARADAARARCRDNLRNLGQPRTSVRTPSPGSTTPGTTSSTRRTRLPSEGPGKGDATDCTVDCNNWFGIYGFPAGGANALMCDGSVRFVGPRLDPLTLAYLAIRDDGHLISPTDY